MKVMNVQSITMQDFAGVKGVRTVDFSPSRMHVLKAPNGYGKSTMIEAFFWCLLGTNKNGISRQESIFFHGKPMSVNVVFTLRDTTLGTEEKMDMTRRYDGKKTGFSLLVDGKKVAWKATTPFFPMAETLLQMQMGYLSKQAPIDARSTLMNALPTVDEEDVLIRFEEEELALIKAALLPEEWLPQGWKNASKRLREKVRVTQGQLTVQEGEKKASEEELIKARTDLEGFAKMATDMEAMALDVAEKTKAIELLEADETCKAQEREAFLRLEKAKMGEKKKAMAHVEGLFAKKEALLAQYRKSQQVIDMIQQEIDGLVPITTTCSLCSAPLTAEKVKKAQQEREALLKNKEDRKRKEQEELRVIQAAGKEAQAEYLAQKAIAEALPDEDMTLLLAEHEAAKKAIEAQKEQIKALRLPCEAINKELHQYEASKKMAEKAVEKAKKKVEAVIGQMAETSLQLMEDKKIVGLFQSFRRWYLEEQEAKMTKGLDGDVQIVLWDRVVEDDGTEDWLPVFRLLGKNEAGDFVPYAKLSTGEAMKVDALLCHRFTGLNDLILPVFVDNSESMTIMHPSLPADKEAIYLYASETFAVENMTIR